MENKNESYNRVGFTFLDERAVQIRELRDDFLRVFNEISYSNGAGNIKNDEDIISLYNSENRYLWVAAYDQLRQLPGIYSLVDKDMLALINEICDLKFCAYTSRITVRADMPMGEGSTPTPAHQDYPTHQGSGNSITLWIPLQDVSSEDGAIQVVRGSHRLGMIIDDENVNEFTQDPGNLKRHFGVRGHLESSKHLDGQFEEVPMSAGQILVFSTLLLHRSGVNVGNNIRYSLNIRLNDLADPNYAKRYYYLNETASIKTSEVNFDVRFPE